GVAGEARVDPAAGQPSAAQQLDVELTERGPQVRFQQIFFAQPREVRELLRHGRFLRGGEGAPLVERVGVLVLRVLARLFADLGQAGGVSLERIVVARHRGVARQIKDVRPVVAWGERERREVEHRRDQYNAVEVYGVTVLQQVAQHSRAKRPVAFADEK